MNLTSEEFHQFYNDHAELVRNIIHRMHGNQDIDDLVQNVFVKIYFNLHKFQGNSQIKTWIYRIAVNVVKDHWKMTSRRSWLSFFKNTELLEEGNSQEYDKLIEVKEASAFIQKKLTIKLREVIVLYSFQELNPKEIGEILGIPEGTVKSRLHKAHMILKKHKLLEEEHETA